MMESYFKLSARPMARAENIVSGANYRFTVLSDRIIRMEYSQSGQFVDAATQTVLNRDFPPAEYVVRDEPECLEIATKYLHLIYDKKKFSSSGLCIQMFYNPYLKKQGTWFFGDEAMLNTGNLGGTAETLDTAVGDTYYLDDGDDAYPWGVPYRKVELGRGLMSKNGFTVIDDSKSILLREDGWYDPALAGHLDFYFFCYGRDYLGCLKEFYYMAGKPPLLPRCVLGNWWSRYYSYSDTEYLALMDKFQEEGIPFSMSVLDMGWHLVQIDSKYGKGWTGYTWNRDLFPHPEKFLCQLHERGKHVALNVHPADGVRAHEERYPQMAQAMGIEPESKQPVAFDVTNETFMKAYFSILHTPLEEDGVDLWWIDWQQGSNALKPGVDPLWVLNHYHFLDSGKGGKRPLTFSRYAGLGSHRYPIGFSGSTYITWESLDYQPYFTATASNVGYGWWSHDIGGHRNGYRDDELTARWVQYGCFSPIMRLHSSDEVFTGREPWKFCADTERVMRFFLRFRHRLIPYLYTMNARSHFIGEPLVQPMYYKHADNNRAYGVKNEYYFGTELIVNPITSKADPQLCAGKVKTWLPDGMWFDIFTGMKYAGRKIIDMFRPIDTIPVLGKAGGIVPLQAESEICSRTDNPTELELLVFTGASGSFSLYEDDGESKKYESGSFAVTRYELNWGEEKSFVIEPPEGDLSVIPPVRNYTIRFYGVDASSLAVPWRSETQFDEKRNILTVKVKGVAGEKVVVPFQDSVLPKDNPILSYAYEALNRTQTAFSWKEKLFSLLKSGDDHARILSSMLSMNVSEGLKAMITEILLADEERISKG
ncbi:MAG: TIM-barrel domain-containing protein [Oscillospiraceae bacterium]